MRKKNSGYMDEEKDDPQWDGPFVPEDYEKVDVPPLSSIDKGKEYSKG